MKYLHECGKMEARHGTGALMTYLDNRNAEGWELIAFETIGIQVGGSLAIPGAAAPQQVPGWFMIFRKRVVEPCMCDSPMG